MSDEALDREWVPGLGTPPPPQVETGGQDHQSVVGGVGSGLWTNPAIMHPGAASLAHHSIVQDRPRACVADPGSLVRRAMLEGGVGDHQPPVSAGVKESLTIVVRLRIFPPRRGVGVMRRPMVRLTQVTRLTPRSWEMAVRAQDVLPKVSLRA